MEPLLALGFAVVILAFMLLVGAPIGVALGLTGMWGLWVYGGTNALNLVAANAHSLMTSFVLVSLPLFLLIGILLEKGGVGTYLFEAASNWLGRLPGGLAVATVIACALASAIAGVSIAVVGAIAPGAVSEMIKRGYHRRVAAGVVCVAASLGILIPPSIPFIFYGVMAEVPIGRLFIGGIVPALILVTLYIIAIVIWRRLSPSMIPIVSGVSWQQRGKSLIAMVPALAVSLLVLGSIYFAIATPTESSAIGAIGIFILAAFVYRKLSRKAAVESLIGTAEVTGMCALLMVGGTTFAYSIAALRIPFELADRVIALGLTPVAFVLLINFIGIILGCFMDVLSLLIILTPLTVPIIVSFGYDPVWWGVVLVMNGEIAVVTPPVGLNLYVLQGVTGIPLGEILRGALPLLSCNLVALLIVIFFPDTALWLPRLMMR